MKRLSCRRVVLCMASVLVAGAAARGGDWPQILGPHRDGIADGEQLAESWPKVGPKTLWQRPVGSGLAGVAVAGGRVVLFHRQADEEIAEALAAGTGKGIWKTPFSVSYDSTISSDNGPRCVPVIHEGLVYLFGPSGNLHCVALESGKIVWERALYEEYQAPEGYFGAGSTPIVEGGKLLVNVGSKAGAGLVALDLKNGKTVWKATDEQASYSAPAAATIDGTRHVIFVTRLHLLSIDPADGKVRFSIPFGQSGPTVNAATPLILDGHVFVSASYGIGALLAKIEPNRASTIWANDDVMSSQYSTCVLYDGYLYGIDGRQDQGEASLRCIDPKAGKVIWSQDGFGVATPILASDKLLLMKTNGELVLARPSPKGYQELAKAHVLEGASPGRPALALPALANGRLYVRDAKTLKCLEIGNR